MGILWLRQKLPGLTEVSPPVYKTMVLGRPDPNADQWWVASPLKQRHGGQAIISVDGDSFFIQPIEKNPITVNNVKLTGLFHSQRRQLQDGNIIELGNGPTRVQLEVIIHPLLGKSIKETQDVLWFICNSYGFTNTKPILQDKWLQFDFPNQQFEQYFPDEEAAAIEIKGSNAISERTLFRSFFKIYLYFSPSYVLAEFDKVLQAIQATGVRSISGKVGCLLDIYRNEHVAKIVLYVVGGREKEILLAAFKRIAFEPNSKIYAIDEFVKRVNPYIAWNQGGDSIRRAADSVGTLRQYFYGEKFHLIRPEVLS